MNLYSYIIARDFGFAPNPFYGWCTLATCKPLIRSNAQIGDWVIGTGAKTKYRLAGHLIYAMRVDEVLTFDNYWSDQRFFCKRPLLNGSLKQMYGDNIYHRTGNRWIQEDSHHSKEKGRPNKKNINNDTKANRILASSKFVYYGNHAPEIPKIFRPYNKTGENICCPGRNHIRISGDLAKVFINWLKERNEWGFRAVPLEFAKHKRRL